MGHGLTDGFDSQWYGERRLTGGDWRVRARADVAGGAQRRAIGCGGLGAGGWTDVRERAPRPG